MWYSVRLSVWILQISWKPYINSIRSNDNAWGRVQRTHKQTTFLELFLSIVFKARKNILPGNIQKLFCDRQSGYYLRGELNLKKIHYRTIKKGLCLSNRGVDLWNGKSDDLRNCVNVSQFKKSYKKQVFCEYERLGWILLIWSHVVGKKKEKEEKSHCCDAISTLNILI